ncbi:hypothetical protein TQ39_18055 [Ruthenibacterium lactatiformans]|uniref:AI2M/AI1M-like HNH endonuclease domain-containing protein n=2 Tax=Ruthenibacterium lactatiformans TaxID=1550024 RepID=A0A0D8IVC1_9FIRM|nr:hypothetical protein TQ39_18055 [Ruthenibacterium lactatiformans]
MRGCGVYKTLAAKYHTKVRSIRDKYRIGKDFGIRYETKFGMKTALFYNESFRIQTEVVTGEFDTIAKSYFRISPCSLIQRLKARKCKWCETENVDLEVHHVRRLKDLKGKALWERAMIGRRRKTMVLCTACHDLLHAGKLY